MFRITRRVYVRFNINSLESYYIPLMYAHSYKAGARVRIARATGKLQSGKSSRG